MITLKADDRNDGVVSINGHTLFTPINDKLPGPGIIQDVAQSFVDAYYSPSKREKIWRLQENDPQSKSDLDNFLDVQLSTLKTLLIDLYDAKEIVLNYEKALIRRTYLLDRINGRDGVQSRDEVIDPVTLEITQSRLSGVIEIIRWPEKVHSLDDKGNIIAIDNPDLADAQNELLQVQNTINSVNTMSDDSNVRKIMEARAI